MIHVTLPQAFNMPKIGMYTSNRLVDPGTKFISREKIIEVVEKHFGTTLQQLDVKSRKTEIRWPRQVMIYFLVKYTQISLQQIGNEFHRYHTTVIHSVQSVRDLLDTEENVVMEIKHLTEKMYS